MLKGESQLSWDGELNLEGEVSLDGEYQVGKVNHTVGMMKPS